MTLKKKKNCVRRVDWCSIIQIGRMNREQHKFIVSTTEKDNMQINLQHPC